MKKDLANKFQNEMYACSIKYKEKTKRTPIRYHQMIKRLGGVGAARDLALAPGFQTGLEKAAEHDCISRRKRCAARISDYSQKGTVTPFADHVRYEYPRLIPRTKDENHGTSS